MPRRDRADEFGALVLRLHAYRINSQFVITQTKGARNPRSTAAFHAAVLPWRRQHPCQPRPSAARESRRLRRLGAGRGRTLDRHRSHGLDEGRSSIRTRGTVATTTSAANRQPRGKRMRAAALPSGAVLWWLRALVLSGRVVCPQEQCAVAPCSGAVLDRVVCLREQCCRPVSMSPGALVLYFAEWSALRNSAVVLCLVLCSAKCTVLRAPPARTCAAPPSSAPT